MCLSQVVILIMGPNQVTTIGKVLNGQGALTTTECSAYQAITNTVFQLALSDTLSVTSALATKCPGTHLQMHWQLKCSGKQSARANKEHKHKQGTNVFRLPQALTMPESCQIDHRRLTLSQCALTKPVDRLHYQECVLNN